ncbi:MAG: Sip1-related alpha-galactosidase [Phycisphaerae bacterium]
MRPGFAGPPDSAGVLLEEPLSLPPFEVAAYFANPWWWPGAGNLRHPYLTSDFTGEFPEGGQFLLVRIATDLYFALLPMADEQSYAWLAVTEGQLVLRVGTHGRGNVDGDLPLCAWAVARDPYDVCQQVWREALKWPGVTARLREDKPYAEVFRYLGWCSWEEFSRGITDENMPAAVRAMAECPIPVRYAIIDDGHQDYCREDTYFDRALVSFKPHPQRFAGGYASLVAEKSPEAVRWLGAWSTLLGGLAGIAPDNNLGSLNCALAKAANGCLLVKDDDQSARRFMDAMIGAFKTAGFDLVKIDFISSMIMWYLGATEMLRRPAGNSAAFDNPARVSARLSRALESAVERFGVELLNCNGNGATNFFNMSHSNAARCSDDYSKGNRERARAHLFHSFAIIPWLGQVAWGDHDMFHSCDPMAGRQMAISKAISGGPVYLSDNPRDFVSQYVMPLCCADGRLLRPLAPGAPLTESLWVDPVNQPTPYRVIAPLPGSAAAIVAYNLYKDERDLAASVAPGDYRRAGCMMQPYPGLWDLPPEGLVLWDWHEQTGRALDAPYEFTLKSLADRLLLLAPIRHGWAVIGLTDKYLSPAAVTIESASPTQLILTLVEPGPLVIYAASGRPQADALAFTEIGGGYWRAEPTQSTSIKIARA